MLLPSSASTNTQLASGVAGFLKGRCEGLLDEARPGRPRSIDDDQVAGVIERTLRTTRDILKAIKKTPSVPTQRYIPTATPTQASKSKWLGVLRWLFGG
jgi:hypothetical protein